MYDEDLSKIEKIITSHMKDAVEKAKEFTVVGIEIDHIRRQQQQMAFKRQQGIQAVKQIQAAQQRNQEELERYAHDKTISLLGTKNQHGQYRCSDGFWVNSYEELIDREDQLSQPSNLEGKAEKAVRSVDQKLGLTKKIPEWK